ncbi:MAG: tRNA (cytidine(34)-2'-O)-methyltransferase [Clostridiales bacterium]|nr:tRNA (cytidine(34)-2'-O)-methyltransferase [Clostridiales bacterium]MBS5878459.1 tRNA (cytidine(34)-2'-O)-methyltransferase [Clostridiales bacterium]
MFNIVLHEPEMPANTGNIGRTCVATGASLHLIRPLGFRLDEKQIKRAGMDYWDKIDLHVYDDYADFIEKNPRACSRMFFATTKAEKTYADARFEPGDYIMFGKESAGIPEEILVSKKDMCIRIPMLEDIRSLNLSNSAAIILYEAFRQNNFGHLQNQGHLHHLEWQ